MKVFYIVDACTLIMYEQFNESITCIPLSRYCQDSEGMLDFLPGERLKFITVTIVDNPAPELEKMFRVELYDADGGGEKLDPKTTRVSLKILLPVLIRDELRILPYSCCFFTFCVLCPCVLTHTNLPTTYQPTYLPS